MTQLQEVEQHRGTRFKISRAELIMDVPAEAAEPAPLIHHRVEKTEAVYETPVGLAKVHARTFVLWSQFIHVLLIFFVRDKVSKLLFDVVSDAFGWLNRYFDAIREKRNWEVGSWDARQYKSELLMDELLFGGVFQFFYF